MRRELIATATFGLEAVVRREIQSLGYEVVRTEDGKVTYLADERGIVRSNLWLRCADRVLLKVAEFDAPDFETLFQRTGGIPWEEIIPADGRFTVLCTTVKSALHNEPACQRTVKKAIALRLQEFYVRESMPETGAAYTVKLTLLRDRATLTIDTSGAGLHKRGYRVTSVAAPMKETLAAALVQLSFWKPGRLLIDPCCGSGTIPIEAAMIGANIAPGLSRGFASEEWEIIGEDIWKEERREAFAAIRQDASLEICASDVDPRALEAARENAEEAGVGDIIRLKQISLADRVKTGDFRQEGTVVVTNPPYGERIGEKKTIAGIYASFRLAMEVNPGLSLFAITADKGIEEALGRKADRRRKLFNGNIEATYYQFHGQRLGRKSVDMAGSGPVADRRQDG
ncbi:MAG: class I SAM-dependent RNA methyltransferase [Firmicutes bacterium]|nr:class I SAM-dependent RNA methyltransferase [Bacillota bacterium]